MKYINLLSLVTTFISFGAAASDYPADYCQQRVHVVNDGASLIARVGSGCTDLLVIGYKNSGVLATNDVQEIDAVVTGSCSGSWEKRTTVIKLGKEWNGAGYVNKPSYEKSSVLPGSCYRDTSAIISVAYSDRKGNWDSRYGQNYNVKSTDLYSTATKTILSPNYGPEIGLDSWKIIVNELRN
jgi:hypothetical protein